VLQDNTHAYFVPLFIALKLFKSGHLFMPMCFYSHQKKWREMALHGEDNYGFGYGLEMGEKPYELNNADVAQFQNFKTTISPHLEFLNFSCIPYRKPPKALQTTAAIRVWMQRSTIGSWKSRWVFFQTGFLPSFQCRTTVFSVRKNWSARWPVQTAQSKVVETGSS